MAISGKYGKVKIPKIREDEPVFQDPGALSEVRKRIDLVSRSVSIDLNLALTCS